MIMYSCSCGATRVSFLHGQNVHCHACNGPANIPIEDPVPSAMLVVDRCHACTALEQRVARLEAQLAHREHSKTDHEAEYIKQFAPCGHCGAMGGHTIDCPTYR